MKALDNLITINRGDTYSFPLYINIGSQIDIKKLELTETMSVYVGVTESNQKFENAIIRKKYTAKDMDENKDIKIIFYPEDTVNLKEGKYYISIKLVDTSTEPDTVTTICSKKLFYII